jgi:chromosome segregation ATPase
VAQTEEAVKTDQKERDRADELVKLNQRVGAIQERFAELDADYAASLANWKRNEIDAERAKLKDELSTIATRVHELSGTP